MYRFLYTVINDPGIWTITGEVRLFTIPVRHVADKAFLPNRPVRYLIETTSLTDILLFSGYIIAERVVQDV